MKSFDCERERDVLEATRLGRWNEDLEAHVSTCATCQDLSVVSAFLESEAHSARSEAPLPGPGLIWWKAQLLARRAAAEQATRPIAVYEKAATALGVLGVLGAVVWNAERIQGWLEPVALAAGRLGSMEGAFPGALLALGAGSCLFVLLMLFALYAVWAEG